MPVPLLVFLHGSGQTPQSWQDQVTALPSGTKAVAPWLLGCRPGATAPFELGRAADAVLALLNQHGVEQVALCGVGLGAAVALEAAIRAPEAVSHLVVFGITTHTPGWAAALQRATLAAVPMSRFVDAGVTKAKLAELVKAQTSADFRGRLGQVTARTLVLAPDGDPAGTAAARTLASRVPGARCEVVPGARSALNQEAAGPFNDLLYGFLA